jgi:predicted dehydrogenase
MGEVESSPQREDRPIRWGFWGTGAIAHAVASDLRRVRGSVLHAVGSRTLPNAERFAAQWGVRKCHAGLEALLDDERIDIVYIASPNDRHAPDSLAVIRAGKAVLCEKPFTLNLAQAEEVVRAAREQRVFCMEAMWTRFIPAVQQAKRWVDLGVLGTIRLMQGSFSYPASASQSRLFNRELGGGALLDRGVYLISLAQYLQGAPRCVRGVASIGETGVDEQSAYQLVYPNGALADFAASLRTRGANEAIVAGDRGTIRLCEPFYRAHRIVLQRFPPPEELPARDGAQSRGAMGKIVRSLKRAPVAQWLLRRVGPAQRLLEPRQVRVFPFPGHGYQFQLRHVGDCLRQRRLESPIMPLDDSLEVMRVMDEIASQIGLRHPASVSSGSH